VVLQVFKARHADPIVRDVKVLQALKIKNHLEVEAEIGLDPIHLKGQLSEALVLAEQHQIAQFLPYS
jgi:hypothetical protein